MKPRLARASALLPRNNPDARGSRRYSRFVGTMKFLLPTAAAVLIALIVAWPRLDSTDGGFRFSFADLERDKEGSLGVSKARFAGTDNQMRPFLVTAERAVQMQGFEVFNLTTLQADITTGSGTWVSITAQSGVYRREERTLTLLGPIDIFTNAGYELHGEEATVDLDLGLVESKLPVQGHGPLGAIRADTLRYSTDGKNLKLEGRVHVVMNPRTDG